MKKLTYLVTFASGYVLGARAGRAHYDTLRSAAQRVTRDPRTQHAVQSATEAAKAHAPAVTDRVSDAAHAMADKVRPSSTPTKQPDSPDRSDRGVPGQSPSSDQGTIVAPTPTGPAAP